MPFDIGTLGMGVANAAAGGLLGIALGGVNDQRQLEQQGKLTNQQVNAQKNLTDYNQQKAYEMWEKTNYAAQIEQMKKAGLSPGLIYGKGGAGGATMSVTPGSVTGGQAPHGGGEVVAMSQMGIQSAQAQAQIELAKSQANLNNTQAAKLAGVDTEQTKANTENLGWQSKSLAQGIENQKAQASLTKADTYLKQLDGEIKAQTLDDQVDQIIWNAKRAKTELANAENETYINQTTKQDKIRTIHEQAIYSYLANNLLKSDINNTDADTAKKKTEIRQISNSIAQQWASINQTDTKNQQEQQKIVLQKVFQDYQMSHPGTSQVIGNLLGNTSTNIQQGLEKMRRELHNYTKE